MTFDQSDDEVHAHLNGAAATVVGKWICAVFTDERWDEAMSLMTLEGREKYVRAWDDTLKEAEVERLVGVDTAHPFWPEFARTMLEDHAEAFGDLADNLAIASRPRPYDIDTELVLLVDYRTVPAPITELAGVEARIVSGMSLPPTVEFKVSYASGTALIDDWHPGPDFPGLDA